MSIKTFFLGTITAISFLGSLSAFAGPQAPAVNDMLVCYPASGELDIIFPHMSAPGKISVQGTVIVKDQYPDSVTYNDVQLSVELTHFTGDAPTALNLSSATVNFSSPTTLTIGLIQPGAYTFNLTGLLNGILIPENTQGGCTYLNGNVDRPALSGGN